MEKEYIKGYRYSYRPGAMVRQRAQFWCTVPGHDDVFVDADDPRVIDDDKENRIVILTEPLS